MRASPREMRLSGPDFVECQRFRECQRLRTGLQRSFRFAEERVDGCQVADRLRLLPRGLRRAQELDRVGCPHCRDVAVAPVVREPGKEHVGVRRPPEIAADDELVTCLRQLCVAAPLRPEQRTSEVEHELRSQAIVRRPELDCRAEEPRGRRVRVHRERPLARVPKRRPGPFLQIAGLLMGELCVLERTRVVVREQLRQVRAARSQRLDPGSGCPVLLGARGARDLGVRDVADKHMPERVLALVRDSAPRPRPHQFLPLELPEPSLDLLGVETADVRQAPTQNPVPITAASRRTSFAPDGACPAARR
jgi:hypothetical protein